MQLKDSQSSDDRALPAPVMVAGSELRLFAESPDLIEAMLADIRVAQSRVWMESYIFADDQVGRAVAAALVERARAGLDVRLVIDGLGSFSLSNTFLHRLREAGVRVHVFHSLGNALRAPRLLQALNQRNHRKLLIIDEAVAYFGGMNIVDQSGLRTTADAKRRGLPGSAGWRDVHARLAGPHQSEIAAMMERLWRRAHRQPRTKPPRWSVPNFARAPREVIYFFDSRPTFTDRRPHRVLVPLIREAQREITVSMAYFIPRGRVLRELLKARRRGVRVRVIVPEVSDIKVVQWATRHFYEYLLKRGIVVYERRQRMLHSKAMVIDGRWSVIGSCNLDVRSLRINLEFLAVIHSPPLALELNRICLEEMQASRRVDAEYCRRRSYWQRQLDRLAWGFRKWL